jgi:hypothetical protein
MHLGNNYAIYISFLIGSTRKKSFWHIFEILKRREFEIKDQIVLYVRLFCFSVLLKSKNFALGPSM